MLEISNLNTHFPTSRGLVKAVAGVDFLLEPGRIVGLVGESGCGKSMTLLSILRLVPYPGRLSGQIWFEGRDLLQESPAAMRRVRGRAIAMVFQDPMTTLNPVFRVGEQIRESLRIHGLVGRAPARAQREMVLSLMEEVGIPSPSARYHQYPHEFSGGMQQRALMAIALACQPKVLLADEPTTALDVTIQAQILDLLRHINRQRKTAMVLVTHDLAVASEFCHEIAVMYAGRLVEIGPTREVIYHPAHPYTRGLLGSIPRITRERARLSPIPGNVPDLAGLAATCAFAPRCAEALPRCREEDPGLCDAGPGHTARCLRLKGGG
ncbi:MAG: ABC transporter ATP-binding protein [Bacillota bacterium]